MLIITNLATNLCGPSKDVIISLCTGPTSFSYLFLCLPPFSFVSGLARHFPARKEKKYDLAKLSLVVLLHFYEESNNNNNKS